MVPEPLKTGILLKYWCVHMIPYAWQILAATWLWDSVALMLRKLPNWEYIIMHSFSLLIFDEHIQWTQKSFIPLIIISDCANTLVLHILHKYVTLEYFKSWDSSKSYRNSCFISAILYVVLVSGIILLILLIYSYIFINKN